MNKRDKTNYKLQLHNVETNKGEGIKNGTALLGKLK